MFEYLANKKVLVTGGCGTVGHALAEEFKNIPGLQHYIVSRNEASQFRLQQKYPNIKCLWGDVANNLDMERVFQEVKPNIVIHAAAVKVIPTAEKEMLKTFEINALGTYNVAMMCLKYDVEAALMIGTDKQCSPINVYGMTKHIGTSIFSDANRLGKTKFISTRYGNVLCSRSSLGVIIMDQAKAGQALTVTDPDMTRFFFTIQEGISLIDRALGRIFRAAGMPEWQERWYGATVSTQMCAVRLGDFFDVVAERFNVPVKIIGRRAGEKTHEHLMADYELKDTYLDSSCYWPEYAPQHCLRPYITVPHLGGSQFEKSIPCSERPKQVFSSDIAPRLSKDEIWKILDYAYNNTWKD